MTSTSPTSAGRSPVTPYVGFGAGYGLNPGRSIRGQAAALMPVVPDLCR